MGGLRLPPARPAGSRVGEDLPRPAPRQRPRAGVRLSFAGRSAVLSTKTKRVRIAARSPVMQVSRCRPSAATAACLPAAAASLFRCDGVRNRGSTGLSAPVRRFRDGRGLPALNPSRCNAPRQSGSTPGCCQVVREVSEGFAETACRLGYAPVRCRSATWRTVPCAVHLPARRVMIAAWHVGRGSSHARAGFPRQTLDCSSAPGFPDYRVSPAGAASLRRRRTASTRPTCAGLPRCPPTMSHEATTRRGAPYTRHQSGTIPVLVSALAATGLPPRFAPRHYRKSAAPWRGAGRSDGAQVAPFRHPARRSHARPGARPQVSLTPPPARKRRFRARSRPDPRPRRARQWPHFREQGPGEATLRAATARLPQPAAQPMVSRNGLHAAHQLDDNALAVRDIASGLPCRAIVNLSRRRVCVSPAGP